MTYRCTDAFLLSWEKDFFSSCTLVEFQLACSLRLTDSSFMDYKSIFEKVAQFAYLVRRKQNTDHDEH